jgi:hypothetical protein
MRCPYLLSGSERVCLLMAETEFSGEISDSDYERYCDGNQYYCYYFRRAGEKTEAVKKQRESTQRQLV